MQSGRRHIWAVQISTILHVTECGLANNHQHGRHYDIRLQSSHFPAPGCFPAPLLPARASSAAAERSSRRWCLQYSDETAICMEHAVTGQVRDCKVHMSRTSQTSGQEAVDGAGLPLAIPPNARHCLQKGTPTFREERSRELRGVVRVTVLRRVTTWRS
jgi:hypothetical protein